MHKLKKLWFHPDLRKRTVITISCCASIIIVNFFVLQLFCIPVFYASLLFLFFLIAIISLPFVKQKALGYLSYFFCGTGIPVCLYMVWFLFLPAREDFIEYIIYLFVISFAGVGLVVLVPFYLLFHICQYYKCAGSTNRISLIMGGVAPCLILMIYLGEFNANYKIIESAIVMDKNNVLIAKELPRNYFTERFMGIGIKYHTRLDCVYDGWRPPLHDPMLNIALFVYVGSYYPYPYLNRLELYKIYFPQKPVHISCPCSYIRDGKDYLRPNWDQNLPNGKIRRIEL